MNLVSFIYPLFLTLLIETPIYFELGKKKNIVVFLTLITLNVISNLLFNYLYILLDYSFVFLILGEFIVTFIAFIEGAVLYLIFNFKKCFLTILANFLSFIVGYLLNTYLIKTTDSLLIATLIFETAFLIYFVIEVVIQMKKFIKRKS